MNRRIRLVAALIALVGFTAYFAESLVASACVPAGGTATASGAGTGSDPDLHAGNHHTAPAAMDAAQQPVGSDPVSSDPVGTHCPLAMPGGSTCTVAATLPPPANSIQAIEHAYHQHTPIVETAVGLLAIEPFFRPPRR